MLHLLYHLLVEDLWYPIWPNLAASLIVYVFVFLKMRSITKLHEEQVKLHRELKDLHIQHHREQMAAIKTGSGTE